MTSAFSTVSSAARASGPMSPRKGPCPSSARSGASSITVGVPPRLRANVSVTSATSAVVRDGRVGLPLTPTTEMVRGMIS